MSETPTIGAYLRAARRKRRVSIERAAEDTKIRADFLMRMESDEFDFLAPAYVRGFLRSYARYLRVDPVPLVTEIDRRFETRLEASEILAAERRRRAGAAMRGPRKINSWAVAAVFAALVLVGLGWIGLAQPDPTGPPENLAEQSSSPTPEESETPVEEPTESPPPEDDALAFDNGIKVEVIASEARCWVDFTADGAHLTPGGITLEVGDSSGIFRADREMDIVLGAPYGVEIIVNGVNIGSPGGTSPDTINIPADVENF